MSELKYIDLESTVFKIGDSNMMLHGFVPKGTPQIGKPMLLSPVFVPVDIEKVKEMLNATEKTQENDSEN